VAVCMSYMLACLCACLPLLLCLLIPFCSPDKNPNTPEVHRRFEQLGLIHRILRDERRDRYNHFLSNGFPKWRGTGYFYSRFRPGLLMVLSLVLSLSVGVQYLIQISSWRKNQKQIENLRRSALAVAWGAAFQTPASASKTLKSRPHPQQKKVQVPIHGFGEMPPAPAQCDIISGKVDWDAEANKVREAMNAPMPATDEAPTIVEVIVFADGSMVVNDAKSGELIPVEPLPESESPTLKSTWPFQLFHSLAGASKKTAPEVMDKNDDKDEHRQDIPSESVLSPEQETTGFTSAKESKKSAGKRRKRNNKAQQN